MTLYTDINPECCAWLGSRVEDGSLPPGDVLMADVRDIGADQVAGYEQVHLFAGIGGLALGLALAGWPAGVRVLTGGFPCQDISTAGKGAGLAGKRSGLFWELQRVASLFAADALLVENVGALGRRGLDVVAAALGEAGYLVPEAYRVGAWSLGAPHERERWWIVGYGRAIGCTVRFRLRDKEAGRRGPHRGPASESGAQIFADASQERRLARRGADRDQAGARSGRDQPEAGDQVQTDSGSLPREQLRGADQERGRTEETEQAGVGGWCDPCPGPWRRADDEWQYAGPPVFVYRTGQRRAERDAAAQPRAARFTPRRPDPTVSRGWTVPVLPGYVQHEWEEPRLHQRGVGCAVHGLPGRLADALNKCGVMACGNAVVPQVPKAIARGMMAAMRAGVMA